MALSTQTVVITVVVKGGNATNLLNALGVNAGQAGAGAQRATKSFASLSGMLGTLSRALVSMLGVLIAFNVVITLPEKIAQGLLGIAKAAITAADETSRAMISLAGVIATFMDFGPTIAKSFEGAAAASQRLLVTFTQLAAKSLATPQQMMMGFQSFLSRGGGEYVKSLDEAANITKILVDATLALTQGQQAEKQIQTEIASLMEGQARAGSVLARLIKAQVGDLATWLQQQKAQGTLFESIQRMLGPLAEAGNKLGETFGGIVNSVKGTLTILTELAMRQGGLKPLLEVGRELRDTLSTALKELLNTPDQMSEASQKVVTAFATISAGIQIAIENFVAFIKAFMGANDTADLFVEAAQRIAKGLIVVGAVIEGVVGFVYGLFKTVYSIFELSYAIMGTVENMLRFRFNLESSKKNFEEYKDAFMDMGSGAKWMLSSVTESTAAAASGIDRVGKEVPAIVARMKKAIAEGAEGKFKLIDRPSEEQATRAIERLRREIALIYADQNEVLKIEIKRAEAAEEIILKYGTIGKETRTLLGLNKELEIAEKWALSLRTERGSIRQIKDQIQTLLAGTNEYSKLAQTIANRERDVLEKLEGQYDARLKILGLMRELTDLEMTADARQKIAATELDIIRETQGEAAALEVQNERNYRAAIQGMLLIQKNREALVSAVSQTDKIIQGAASLKPVVVAKTVAEAIATPVRAAPETRTAAEAPLAALNEQKETTAAITALEKSRIPINQVTTDALNKQLSIKNDLLSQNTASRQAIVVEANTLNTYKSTLSNIADIESARTAASRGTVSLLEDELKTKIETMKAEITAQQRLEAQTGIIERYKAASTELLSAEQSRIALQNRIQSNIDNELNAKENALRADTSTLTKLSDMNRVYQERIGLIKGISNAVTNSRLGELVQESRLLAERDAAKKAFASEEAEKLNVKITALVAKYREFSDSIAATGSTHERASAAKQAALNREFEAQMRQLGASERLIKLVEEQKITTAEADAVRTTIDTQTIAQKKEILKQLEDELAAIKNIQSAQKLTPAAAIPRDALNVRLQEEALIVKNAVTSEEAYNKEKAFIKSITAAEKDRADAVANIASLLEKELTSQAALLRTAVTAGGQVITQRNVLLQSIEAELDATKRLQAAQKTSQVAAPVRDIVAQYNTEAELILRNAKIDDEARKKKLQLLQDEIQQKLTAASYNSIDLAGIDRLIVAKKDIITADEARNALAEKQLESVRQIYEAQIPYNAIQKEIQTKLEAITTEYQRAFRVIQQTRPSTSMSLADKDRMLEKLTSEYEQQRKLYEAQLANTTASREASAAAISSYERQVSIIREGMRLNARASAERLEQLDAEIRKLEQVASFSNEGIRAFERLKAARDLINSQADEQLRLLGLQNEQNDRTLELVKKDVFARDGVTAALEAETRAYAQRIAVVTANVPQTELVKRLEQQRVMHEENLKSIEKALLASISKNGQAEIDAAIRTHDLQASILASSKDIYMRYVADRLAAIKKEEDAVRASEERKAVARAAAPVAKAVATTGAGAGAGGITVGTTAEHKAAAAAAEQAAIQEEYLGQAIFRNASKIQEAAYWQAQLDSLRLKKSGRQELADLDAQLEKIKGTSEGLIAIEHRRVAAIMKAFEAYKSQPKLFGEIAAKINEISAAERNRTISNAYLGLSNEIDKVLGKMTAYRTLEFEQIAAEDALIAKFYSEETVLEILLMLNDELYAAKRRQIDINERIAKSRVLVDEERQAQEELNIALEKLSMVSRGIGTRKEAMDAIRAAYDKLKKSIVDLEIEQAELNRLIAESKATGGEGLVAYENQLRAVTSAIYDARRAQNELLDSLAASDFAVPTVEQSFKRMIEAMGEFGSAQEVAVQATQIAGVAIAEALGNTIAGTESFGKSLKKIMAGVVKTFGDYVLVRGLEALAEGIWPPNPALLAKGAALVALAGVIYGIAQLMGGTGGKASKPATGGDTTPKTQETRNIYMEPYFQRQNGLLVQMNTTLDRMNDTFSRLSTKSPGVVVMEGAPGAGKVLTNTVTKTMQGDVNARTQMASVVLGEA